MSLIKPVQPVRQQPRRGGVHDAEAEADQKLSRREIAIVASSGIGTIGMLTLIAWLLLPISNHLVPFVVGSALPALTLLAIIYQAIVYRRQWNAMQTALKQTDRVVAKMQAQLNAIREQTSVMQDSLTETQKMAKHSERGVEIAEQSMEYAQRAYVGITRKTGGQTGFMLTIENSGNTPASDVAIVAVTEPGGSPPKLPEGSEGYTHIGVLAPHVPYEHWMPFKRTLTPEEQKEFNDPVWAEFTHWWVVGLIFYRDVFHRNLGDYRQTEFCFYYDQRTNQILAWTSGNAEKEYRNAKQINQPKYPDWWKGPKPN
jgi:hypothetical protein